MSEAKFGNVWHGQLSGTGVTPPGGSEITSINVANGTGGTTAVSYVSPGYMENLGHTYYYKQPGIAAVVTPSAVSAIGGKFENDAILFGSARRYSPFKGGGLLGERCWIHYGSDGKWRKMSLEVVSIGDGTAPVVRVFRHEQFGLINKESPSETTLLGEIFLSGKFVNDPLMSEIDVRHDGRQIVFHMSGKWTNSSDPGASYTTPASQDVPFDNSSHHAIAAAWSLSISSDCTTVSATRVWLAESPSPVASHRGHWETVGPVFVSPIFNGPFYFEYYQQVVGYRTLSPDITWTFERLLTAGFDRFGTLHLVKYRYQSNVIGAVGTLVSGAMFVGFNSTDTLDLTYYNTLDPVSGNYPAPLISDEIRTGVPISWTNTPNSVAFNISIDSGGATKTFTAPLSTTPFSITKTNNASDFRQPTQSICRVAPACIEDSTISGNGDYLFVAFNPRAGSVHSSSSVIGFV